MRPIKLELKYIGPYENELINFEEINHTLFLISGKTGSGKSMIFDAITHALFATASTSARGTESLRSQFAPSTEVSIIAFTFTYRSRTYTVERRLRYFKGTNKTETPPESAIYDEFGDLIEHGLTKVTTFITSLLQISATQFRQIGLLPQGEFRKFLVASSSEKEEILKALFRTERFNTLYQKLKKDHDTDKQDIEMKHALIMNQFSQILGENERSQSFKENLEHLYKLQEHANETLAKKENSYEQLLITKQKLSEEILKEKENNDRVESYYKEKDNLERLLQQKTVIDTKEERLSLSQKVQSIKDAFYNEKEYTKKTIRSEKEVKETEKNYNEKCAENENVRTYLDELINQKSKIDEYKKKVKYLSKYDTIEYQTIQSDIEVLNSEIENNDEAVINKQSELKTLENSLKETEVSDEMLRKAESDRHIKREKLITTENELETAKEVEKNKKEISELNDQVTSITREIKRLETDIEKQNNEVQSLENLDVKSINEMISHLKIGKPCVVCQQTVNQIPNMINFDEEIYIELDSKTKELDSLKMKHLFLSEKEFKESRVSSDLEAEILSLKKELSDQETEINRIDSELKKRHKQETQLAELRSEVQEMTHKLDISKRDLELQLKRYSQFKEDTEYENFTDYKQALNEMEKEIETFESELKKLETEKQNLTLEVTKLESHLESLQYKLDMERNILNENSKKLNVFLSEYEALSRSDLEMLFEVDNEKLKLEIDAFHNKVSQVESLISHIKKNIKSFAIADLTEKLNEESTLNETINIESKSIGQLESKIKELDTLFKKLSSDINSYDEDERAFTDLAKLVELLGGKQGTPTLSRFVLVYYLERILNQANIRLRKMTNGRYELRRAESYRSDQALHIDVFDYFNNARRSVATLSGGESFQASLALALALSEIIQHESGSIDMDMLLIDEGFGTLDEETLKVAIDTLFDLQKSGKMIGIISHVEELKTMIGNVLYVETLDERSQTRLVTPLSN